MTVSRVRVRDFSPVAGVRLLFSLLAQVGPVSGECWITIVGTCAAFPSMSNKPWFDDSLHGGQGHTCRSRVKSWQRDCGLGARVLSSLSASSPDENCWIEIGGTCVAHPSMSNQGWFDDHLHGGRGRTCVSRARSWQQDCGLGARVRYSPERPSPPPDEKFIRWCNGSACEETWGSWTDTAESAVAAAPFNEASF